MRYIAHRGNINGKNIEKENSPDYILEALNKDYDVEIDIWYINNNWFFGHDEPQYLINLYDYKLMYDNRIWFHCKNLESLYELSKYNFIYFWHENDKYTLTSTQNIWTYTNQQLTEKSICVLPELSNYTKKELKICYGICSDFIENYKN